jgi:hypothetical protein
MIETQANKYGQTSTEKADYLAFQQELLTSGLVKNLKLRSQQFQNERKLVQVLGQPISETIIEERR